MLTFFLLILIYASEKISFLISRQDPETFLNTVFHNMTDIGELSFETLDFDVSIGQWDSVYEQLSGIDPSMITVEVYNFHWDT